ncbi:hypothetical protein EXIGLDRAFT_842390 [Exidia glandulosa HHB12029]|uniref:Uncharacterized protein n=1 Tax=Exidia glandulosa HHB12029 TaxID=1314781 RepID=A0A165DC39_EXIGL|nr:hypothetical protein EXIGLDRAFT_842390 [Exidia glandulosa HHB12029]
MAGGRDARTGMTTSLYLFTRHGPRQLRPYHLLHTTTLIAFLRRRSLLCLSLPAPLHGRTTHNILHHSTQETQRRAEACRNETPLCESTLHRSRIPEYPYNPGGDGSYLPTTGRIRSVEHAVVPPELRSSADSTTVCRLATRSLCREEEFKTLRFPRCFPRSWHTTP